MAKLVPVQVFDLIIFGGTGDLSMRKLLPALYHRDRDGQIIEDSRVIAVGRGDIAGQRIGRFMQMLGQRVGDLVHFQLLADHPGGRDEHVLGRDADRAEVIDDCRVQRLLGRVAAAALGEDLDDDRVGALEPQPGVLGDDRVRRPGRDDLEPVAYGDSVHGHDGVMHGAGDLLRVGAGITVVDSDEGHGAFQSLS